MPNHMSIEASRIGRLQEELQRRLAPYRHTALLAAIIAAFFVRPFTGDSGAGPPLFSIALIVLLLLALYNIDIDELVGERETLLAQSRRRNIIAWMLAVPAVGERLLDSFAPSRLLYLTGLDSVDGALCVHYME
jgi:hypothetical protein